MSLSNVLTLKGILKACSNLKNLSFKNCQLVASTINDFLKIISEKRTKVLSQITPEIPFPIMLCFRF